ncbi:MAG: T9SS type A sorting domain-containing protein [Schleiferiaceae bacterium]|nr:T9SS type A sorting domain-containing protein [Schleiferiaceae bacterium]
MSLFDVVVKNCNRKRLFISALFVLLFIAVDVQAQRTERLTVMNYNMLFYRQTTSFCTAAQNSAVAKDGYMRTITGYVQPDILLAQEIGANPVNLDRILTNILNINGVSSWEHAPYFSNNSSNIVNALFFDGNKVGYHSTISLTLDLQGNPIVRSIELHRLYYKDSLLGMDNDTVFFTMGVCHLKAGSSGQDLIDRANATQAVMQAFQFQITDDNRFFAGDFNVRSSTESSFQNLVNHPNQSVRFQDPINRLGTWWNNSTFSDIHTQSTRVTGQDNGGCFSGGGMDDRLDFILVSQPVMDGTQGVRYVPGSYTTLGQDGLRFNRSLIDSTNFKNVSAPDSVIMALYEMSDHLPVIMQIDVNKKTLSNNDLVAAEPKLTYNNPVNGTLIVDLANVQSEQVSLELMDFTGKKVFSTPMERNRQWFSFEGSVQHLPKGLYIMHVSGSGFHINKKLILN